MAEIEIVLLYIVSAILMPVTSVESVGYVIRDWIKL